MKNNLTHTTIDLIKKLFENFNIYIRIHTSFVILKRIMSSTPPNNSINMFAKSDGPGLFGKKTETTQQNMFNQPAQGSTGGILPSSNKQTGSASVGGLTSGSNPLFGNKAVSAPGNTPFGGSNPSVGQPAFGSTPGSGQNAFGSKS